MKKKRARKARVKAVAIPVELDENQPHPKSVLRVVGRPICFIAERLHIASDGRIEKRKLRYVIGGVMMICGSGAAVGASHLHLPPVGHMFVDLVAYAVHGCGAVPFVTNVVRSLELEG